MGDSEPSRTARNAALHRLGLERLPARFGDSEAEDRLARDLTAEADFEPDQRMAGYLPIRTAFFDRVVVNGLARGNTQAAVIGAGYDGRALRYASRGCAGRGHDAWPIVASRARSGPACTGRTASNAATQPHQSQRPSTTGK